MVSLRYLLSFGSLALATSFVGCVVRRRALELLELREEVFAFGDGSRLVDLGPADHALSIDDESRALVHAALIVEDAIGFADRAVRPVVGQEREGNAAEKFRPALETGDGVCADLQDFDVQLLEFFEVRTEPGDLILSPTGECEWQKAHDDRTAAETCQ